LEESSKEHLVIHADRWKTLAVVVVGPAVAFAAVSVFVFLSAFHEPKPHRLPVGIVASPAAAGRLRAAVADNDPGAFDLRSYSNPAQARSEMADRRIDGALVVTTGGSRLLTAEAGGAGAAQALTAAFDALAALTHQRLTVIDVVPPLDGDSEAFSAFFVMLGVLFPSLITGVASALTFPRAGLGWRVGVLATAAVVIGLVAAGIASGVAGFGDYLQIAGIVALFSLAISAPIAALARIKPAAVALGFLFLVVLGLPASGGPGGLGPFGPGFLRVLDPALPLGVAVNALRNTVYFHGHDTSGHLWVLAAWVAAGVATSCMRWSAIGPWLAARIRSTPAYGAAPTIPKP
jgi:hypothetical protein